MLENVNIGGVAALELLLGCWDSWVPVCVPVVLKPVLRA